MLLLASLMLCQEPYFDLISNMVVEQEHRAAVPFPALCSHSSATTMLPHKAPCNVYGLSNEHGQDAWPIIQRPHPDSVSRINMLSLDNISGRCSLHCSTCEQEEPHAKAPQNVFLSLQTSLLTPGSLLPLQVTQGDLCVL